MPGPSELPGRHIDDLAYSALVRNLCKIALITRVIEKNAGRLTKEELVALVTRLTGFSSEALALAGATPQEIDIVTGDLVDGSKESRRPH